MSRYPGLAKVIKQSAEQATQQKTADKIMRKGRALRVFRRLGSEKARLEDDVWVDGAFIDKGSIPSDALRGVSWADVNGKPNLASDESVDNKVGSAERRIKRWVSQNFRPTR